MECERCVKYANCAWRKSGHYPVKCQHFIHVDMVLVTRCRDCHFFRENSLSKHSGFCGYFADGGYAPIVNPNGYCSNAERKSDG